MDSRWSPGGLWLGSGLVLVGSKLDSGCVPGMFQVGSKLVPDCFWVNSGLVPLGSRISFC